MGLVEKAKMTIASMGGLEAGALVADHSKNDLETIIQAAASARELSLLLPSNNLKGMAATAMADYLDRRALEIAGGKL